MYSLTDSPCPPVVAAVQWVPLDFHALIKLALNMNEVNHGMFILYGDKPDILGDAHCIPSFLPPGQNRIVKG